MSYDSADEPNPLLYLVARLSMWIFPTSEAFEYIRRVENWRRCNR